jgi:hypothetical protein
MAYTYEMPLEIPPKEEAQCLQKRKRSLKKYKKIKNKRMAYTYLMLLEIPTKVLQESTKEKTKH